MCRYVLLSFILVSADNYVHWLKLEDYDACFSQLSKISTDTAPKRDHERDLELDKKIQALRRKNEALMRRYKEVEEDKKKAEEEGMALHNRKGKADDLTITISKSISDSRVVVTKPVSSGSPVGKGQQKFGSEGSDGVPPSVGRGQKKQLVVTMTGKKGKRVVSEVPELRPDSTDVKSCANEGQTRRGESHGRGKQPHHMSKKDTAAQGDSKHKEELHRSPELFQEPESPAACTDLNVPTSKEEQEEYLRWKREREQIDRERVARHKNSKGQWRRAWDMDKTDNMFSEKNRDWGAAGRGGRNSRKGQNKSNTEARGHEKQGKDRGAKNVQATSSKAKGKDRLTGRARRWQEDDEGQQQVSESTLEEFLEELDALTEADGEDQKDQVSCLDGTSVSEPPGEASDLTEEASTQGKSGGSSPRPSEKKVRFAEQPTQITDGQNSAGSESSQKVNNDRVVEEGSPSSPASKSTETPPASISNGSLDDMSVEIPKCNTTNTEELIDSGLSVLSLESGEPHPTHSTSSDKAREHGKVV
ncbi:coiled-coil domain-containing protein 9B isoform X1 [Synchiropus splendidus]|uniref:coiled-coil domain-containing protein 9B isoform X1 n=1 Tax=Synchiropus splendidus TaxID=270530 RepID=UPI00237ED43C|nr:coiled-coil domain-containing protein 9B isoform X1 [Synchiropus splendidus]